ncbi:tyrosine-protein phosphatase non-receptor type substrate 1-like [Acanthaster planci]|uniref:Tyrosine-protein phosphatase non-receptor type substrate 1-like n=1 Tax=Acanthaster planci TaxID=133434 RepID=A0A8B7ZXI6_ACAPL|nr:tyrosine-protein phosphatase non-receptor type substrate 1-like [Acanthaster planci]
MVDLQPLFHFWISRANEVKFTMGYFNRSVHGAFMLFLLIACSKGATGISISTDPQITTVREGETATLGCRVGGKSLAEKIRWYRVGMDGALTAISRDRNIEVGATPASGEYSIVGNRRRGEYSLRITNAHRTDSGTYRCGYETTSSVISEVAELQVVLPPDITSPICFMTPTDDSSTAIPGFFRVGDAVRLMCTSLGGIPMASLTWKRGQTALEPSVSRDGVVRVDLVIEESDIDREFTCYADSPALDAPRSCRLTPASAPPYVRIMPDSASLDLRGGTTFACEAEGAIPAESRYTWSLNGETVQNNGRERFVISMDTKSLTMGQIRESDNGAVVACELNVNGRTIGRAEARIDVNGVQETVVVMTTLQPTTPSTSDVSLSLSVSPASTGQSTNQSGTNDTTHQMSMELIIVSAVAGLAVSALAIILIVYIVKKNRKARRKNQQESTPSSNGTGQPTAHLRTKNGVQVSEDGYAMLQKPTINGSSSDYETVGNVLPTVPKPPQSDDEMCWEYEMPYSNEYCKRPTIASNPVYLEITG